VRSRAGDLGDDIGSVAGTLSSYAAEVRPIAERLDALRAEAEAFVQSVAGDDDWREDGAKVDQHNGLLTAVDQQVLALQAAERTAANAINARFGGTQWHAGGSDANAYGPTEIPADAERPWGAPEEKDEPWWKDVWNGGVSLVKGIFVDGLWQDFMGLVGLVNIFDWETFSASWSGLWTLTGKWLYAPEEAAEAWKSFGKALVAWDMWSEDPARALGTVLFNVVTLPLAALKVGTIGKAGKAAKAGRAAGMADEVAGAVGDVGKLPDGTRLADRLADAGRLDPDLPTVGDLARRLDADTPEVRLDDLPARDREPVSVGAREAADDAAAGTRADDAGGGARTDDPAGGDPGGSADHVGGGDDLGGGGRPGSDDLSGGWVGDGGGGQQLRLNPLENAGADALLARARAAEERLSESMLAIRDEIDGAELAGFDNRLKEADSLKTNLATELARPGITYSQALDIVGRDAVRYTLQFPEGSYAAKVLEGFDQLSSRGFELVRHRNFWGGPDYQGINSTWRDPVSGQVFEVQFHTAESFAAKTEAHDLYKRSKLAGTPEEVARLHDAQQEIFDQVPHPPGAEDLRLPEPPARRE
jgi:hypothetical protein